MIEIWKLIVSLIGILVWPTIVMIIVFLFKKQIRSRLEDIKELELPGGFKATLNEAKKADSILEEATSELEKIEKEKVPVDQKNELRRQVLIEKFTELREQTDFNNGVNSHIKPFLREISESNIKNRTLLVFAAGESIKENLQFDIYYDPVNRNHSMPFRYIGLYTEKSVVAIGEIMKIFCCDLVAGKLVARNDSSLSDLSSTEMERIKGIIENTSYYDIDSGHKFYLVDKFNLTNYVKKSNYAIRAKKYFWLNEIDGFKEGMKAGELARLLNGREWE